MSRPSWSRKLDWKYDCGTMGGTYTAWCKVRFSHIRVELFGRRYLRKPWMQLLALWCMYSLRHTILSVGLVFEQYHEFLFPSYIPIFEMFSHLIFLSSVCYTSLAGSSCIEFHLHDVLPTLMLAKKKRGRYPLIMWIKLGKPQLSSFGPTRIISLIDSVSVESEPADLFCLCEDCFLRGSSWALSMIAF